MTANILHNAIQMLTNKSTLIAVAVIIGVSLVLIFVFNRK